MEIVALDHVPVVELCFEDGVSTASCFVVHGQWMRPNDEQRRVLLLQLLGHRFHMGFHAKSCMMVLVFPEKKPLNRAKDLATPILNALGCSATEMVALDRYAAELMGLVEVPPLELQWTEGREFWKLKYRWITSPVRSQRLRGGFAWWLPPSNTLTLTVAEPKSMDEKRRFAWVLFRLAHYGQGQDLRPRLDNFVLFYHIVSMTFREDVKVQRKFNVAKECWAWFTADAHLTDEETEGKKPEIRDPRTWPEAMREEWHALHGMRPPPESNLCEDCGNELAEVCVPDEGWRLEQWRWQLHNCMVGEGLELGNRICDLRWLQEKLKEAPYEELLKAFYEKHFTAGDDGLSFKACSEKCKMADFIIGSNAIIAEGDRLQRAWKWADGNVEGAIEDLRKQRQAISPGERPVIKVFQCMNEACKAKRLRL